MVGLVLLGALMAVVAAAGIGPDLAGAERLRLVRLDAAASALGLLAGAAFAVRWRVDGAAPAWWAGLGLVVVSWPGIAAGGDAGSFAALHTTASVVALAAVTLAVRSPQIDTTIRPALVAAAALGLLALGNAAYRHAPSAPDRFAHAALGAGFLFAAACAAARLRQDPAGPWRPIVPVLVGLGVADAIGVAFSDDVAIASGAAAVVRLVAFGLVAIGALGELQAAAAVQRVAAFRSSIERREAEDRRRALEERVAERMHELRSTVAALEGGVRRLEPHPALDDAEVALARALTREIERLRSLVAEDVHPGDEVFDVREALEPMLTVCRAANWPVSWDLPPVLRARGRPADLAQVVHGLLANATRHAAGSSIDVEAEREGEHVVVRVHDRGPGIAPGTRELIFERGARGPTHDPSGQGLGLAIARRVVRAHDGDLWAEHRPGGGATFVVVLPAPDADTTPSTADHAPVMRDSRGPQARRRARRTAARSAS